MCYNKTFKPHVLILNLTYKIDLLRGGETVSLSNLHTIYYTSKNIKIWYSNNKFKTWAPTWNDKFKLPDGPYSVTDI